MALVSGVNQLDEKKLAQLRHVGKKKVKRSDAETARELTGFAIGGVPPFGHLNRLPTYIDQDLLNFEIIWAAAGTPNAVFPITPAELVQATNGVVADIKVG
jgi:prolyl-tRNA editing enzyme YbaK/EbsC (Cys-tRNA(Pro) deacylase)